MFCLCNAKMVVLAGMMTLGGNQECSKLVFPWNFLPWL